MRSVTRRELAYSLLGVSTIGLSGCLGTDDDSDSDESDDGTDGQPEGDEGDSEPDEEPPENGGDDPQPAPTERATIDWGEEITVVEDWTGSGGAYVSPDEETQLGESPSLLVELFSSSYATGAYEFPEPLDLSDRHLSTAIKVDEPTGGQLEIRLRAPNSDHRYVLNRRLPPEMDEWMRVDLGITRGRGAPSLEEIQELRLHVVGDEETDVKYWIDDFRATDGVGDSYAILAFSGGLKSHYENAFPILEERGLTAAATVSPVSVGASGRMSVSELQELRDAGWDICSFPNREGALSNLPREEQESIIDSTQDWLVDYGFEKGARHFFAPRHRMDGATIDIVQDRHETGFLYGATSAGMPPTAPHTLPMINGGDYDGSRSTILRADRHNQLVVLAFAEIGSDGMSEREFTQQLDRIEDNSYAGGLNVITPSTLVDEFL